MSWLIDGTDLSNLAFNIVDRSAGWKVPAKRGDNLVIPGRNGALWVPNKPFDVGSIVLSMWVVGANEDGTVSSLGAEKQVRSNIDKLTALFAQSHKLLNVVQISSIAYGVKNFFTNPAFAGVASNGAPTYQNSIPNPAPRKRTATAQVKNFYPNPKFATVLPGADPTRINLAPTPHFGYGLGSVVSSSAATLSTINDDSFTTSSLVITPNGASNSSAAFVLGAQDGTMARMGWNVGDTYTVSATVEVTNAQTGTLATDARAISVGINRSGVYNDAEFVSVAAANVAGTLKTTSVTFTIPVDATDVYVRLVNGSINTTESLIWNNILVEKGSAALGYFDGDFANTGDSIYSWVGTPGNSTSTLVYARSKLLIPILYGNMQGGYSTTERNWDQKIPTQIGLIVNSGADVMFPVELHEENDMHKYFLGRLKAVDPDWALAEGDGGNQCLYRPSKYSVTKVINYPFKASRRMSIFTIQHKVSGFTWNHIGNHFRADDPDGSSRDDERAAEAKELIAWIKDNNPTNLTFSGDFNSATTSSGYPRDTFKKAGWLNLKERGPVVNGQYGTRSGTVGGNWIEDIWTKTDVNVQNSALIMTNGSSDHFGWLTTTLVYNANVSLGFVKTYENVYLDPQSKRTRAYASSTVNNFYTPSNYESYNVNDNIASDKWDDSTNSNSSMQATTAADKIANPSGGNRLFQVRLVGNIGANGTIGTKKPFFFNMNDQPLFRTRMRRYNNGTASRSVQVRMQTCKSDGTIGQSGTWQTFALPSGNVTWTDIVYDSSGLACTSTYNYVTIGFRTNEAWVTGDGLCFDLGVTNAKITKFRNTTGFFATTAGPHFDGDSQWVDAYYNGSNANTGSKWDAILDSRWTAAASTSIASAYYAFVQTPKQDPTGTTLSFHSMGFQTGGTQQFTTPCAAPSYYGQPYILRFSAKGIAGLSYTAELLKQSTGQSSPVSVGSVTFTGSATSADSGSGFSDGNFISYTGPSYAPVAGDQLFVRFTTPVILSGTSVLQLSEVNVTNSAYSVIGDMGATLDVSYGWEAERYNSKSLELRHRIKYVSSTSRGHQTSNVSRTNVPVMELYSLGNGDNPKVVFDPQPLISGTGYYFSVNAWGVLAQDAINLNYKTVYAKVTLEFLNSSNAVVATFTGSETAIPTGATSAPSVPFVSAPLTGVPNTATQVRGSVAMSSSLKGTTLLFSKVMLLNTPVSSRHMGNLPYFDGDTGPGYSWLTAADDSISTSTSSVLTRWSSLNAGQVSPSSFVEFKGGPGTDTKPELTISTTLDSSSSGRYLFGAKVLARNEGGGLNSYIPGRVTAKIQFVSAGSVVNTYDITTMPGLFDKVINLQGMVNVSGSFDEIRYLFKSTVTAAVLTIQMSSVYLYADSTNIPVQHLNINKVFNPNFYNLADQWTVSPGVVTDRTDAGGKYTIGLSADAVLTSNRFTVTPGVSLRFATWGRNGTFGQIKFYNSSNVLVSTGTAQIITQDAYNTISASTFAVPASAATAEVTYSSASGISAELRFCYVGEDYATHEENGYYNPLDYPYFDGGVPDFYSSPTTWLGVPDDSASAVIPAIPVGWVYSTDTNAANVNVVIPAQRPPGSSGLVGGLVHAPKGTTRVFRTMGVFRTNNQYLSGQIAVSALPGATVSISLYQASSATGTGTLMLQRNLTNNTGQVFVWNDLLISNDYVYLQISYSETQSTAGYRVWMDNLSFVMTPSPLVGSYPGYFDGNQGGGGWADADSPNNSVSIYYGGGRRAYAEVKEAIDISSMAGGTRAEFSVSLEIPGSFWEDLVMSTLELDVGNGQLLDGTELSLDGLAGGTAPIDDAVLTITTTGTVSGLRIQDVATGGWIKIGQTLPGTVVIDNGNFTVLDGDGNSLITNVTRGGSNQLVPVVPVSSVLPPRFKFSADDTSTGFIFVTVNARRRYVIA